ncbi:hypothetical protein V6N13_139924 [Hibiscus sabdariffa]|uniref:Uncharacterized protein n=1 Tax=Hibiscus sabdariffa TaxID=183260 RepID=A0ABR2QBY8_9ROSI
MVEGIEGPSKRIDEVTVVGDKEEPKVAAKEKVIIAHFLLPKTKHTIVRVVGVNNIVKEMNERTMYEPIRNSTSNGAKQNLTTNKRIT